MMSETLIFNYKGMSKKLLAMGLIVAGVFTTSFTSVNAGYEEIECSTDAVFSEYSCNQCFTGGAKSQDSYIGMLDDLWKNHSEVDQVMYKELQNMPEMVNLNTANVDWEQTPSSDDFWEYTDELNALYNDDQAGYVLPGGSEVIWVKSKLGAAYHLSRNEANSGENIGLLVYPIVSNSIIDGEVSLEDETHKECVLFTSGDEAPVVEEPKKLPQTGPEQFVLLLVLAMVLAFGVLRFRKG